MSLSVQVEDVSACLTGVITSTTARTAPTNKAAVRANVTFILAQLLAKGKATSIRSRGYEGAMPPPPGPVQISHKKYGRRRCPHRFHVSRPPLPGHWIRYWLSSVFCFLV